MNSLSLDCDVCKKKSNNGVLLNGKFICKPCELRENAEYFDQKNNPFVHINEPIINRNKPRDLRNDPCYACGMG